MNDFYWIWTVFALVVLVASCIGVLWLFTRPPERASWRDVQLDQQRAVANRKVR